MNGNLPSSVCASASASDSTYSSNDQSSIRSLGRSSIRTTSSSITKPKRTVRFQDPVPDPIADAVSFHPGPNLSLTSLDLSSDDSSTTSSRSSRSREPSSAASSIAAGKEPFRSASPRFGKLARPSVRREQSCSSTTSTASAPDASEFSEWLARMEEKQSRSVSGRRVESPAGRSAKKGDDQEERKKKRRSWVNLLVR